MTAAAITTLESGVFMSEFTKVGNALLEQMMKTKFSTVQNQVFLAILRKTIGWDKHLDRIALSQIAELTGVQSPHVSVAIKELVKRNIIVKQGSEIGINLDFTTWHLKTNRTGNGNLKTGKVTENRNKQLPTGVTDKVTETRNAKLPTDVIDVTETRNKKLPKPVTTKDTTKNTNTKDTTKDRENASALVSHWLDVMACKVGDKRRKDLTALAKRRLADFSMETLTNAIDGCAKSSYHMGDNPQRTKYNKLELIFRNAEKVETFADIAINSAASCSQPASKHSGFKDRDYHNHGANTEVTW